MDEVLGFLPDELPEARAAVLLRLEDGDVDIGVAVGRVEQPAAAHRVVLAPLQGDTWVMYWIMATGVCAGCMVRWMMPKECDTSHFSPPETLHHPFIPT